MYSHTQGLFAAASVVVWSLSTDYGTTEKATVRYGQGNEEIAEWWGQNIGEREANLNRPSLPRRK